MSTFSEVGGELTALYARGEYAAMLSLARGARERCGDHPATTAYWLACTLCLNGEPAEALDELRRGLAEGCWWRPERLRAEPDLAPLVGMAGYDEVLAECSRRSTAVVARPELVVTRPTGGPAGLLLALHGASWLARDFAPWWTPATELGLVVAVPQSSQPSSSEGFGWEHEELALAEVRAHLRALGADRGPLLLAGFSQGGRLALDWALTGAVEASGVVAVGAALSGRGLVVPPGARDRGLRVRLLAGSADPFLPAIRGFADELGERGVPVELDVAKGVGHMFPPDFGDRLPALLQPLMPPGRPCR